MLKFGTAHWWMLVAIVAAQLAFFVTCLTDRPKLGSDASGGMIVWQSMERGAGWNRFVEPDPANISVDRESFLTWWSPGQYLAVGPLHRLGVDWALAIASATLICSLAGLAGYWQLYRALGFGSVTSALAIAVLSLSWHVTSAYGEFFGGELPLFAVSPWLVAAIVRMRPLRWWSALPFSLVYLAGAMVKLTFCVTGSAAVFGVCCSDFFAAPSRRKLLVLGLKAGSMILVAHTLLWAVFLRYGTNPSDIGPNSQHWWYAVPFVVATPAVSVIGLGGVLGRLFLFPGHAVVGAPEDLAPIYWVMAIGVVMFYWALDRKTVLSADYKRFAGGLVAVYTVVLGSLILSGSSISLDERHFFFVGAVLVPAIVELARNGSSRFWRIVARSCLAVSCAYGGMAVVVHARQLAAASNVGRGGFTQHVISREALSALHDLDDAVSVSRIDALVYVPSPEIALDLRHVRVIATSDLFVLPERLRTRHWHGRVPLLVVLSNPVLEVGGRDEIVRRSFADYSPSEWKRQTVGEWTFYYQGTWPAGRTP
jgi:hypothetical protein